MIFKIKLIVGIFRYFQKSSAAHTKIIVCVLFHVNMLDQTQYSSISPFSNDIFSKTGVHFGFNVKLDTGHLLAYVNDFLCFTRTVTPVHKE